jgi:hypothetical protein
MYIHDASLHHARVDACDFNFGNHEQTDKLLVEKNSFKSAVTISWPDVFQIPHEDVGCNLSHHLL